MNEKLTAVNLLCENIENPIGIEKANPCFSWRLKSTKRGCVQKAYRIIVSSSMALLNKDNGDMWDTGIVNSKETLSIRYEGKEIADFQRCYWKVAVWEMNDTEETQVFSEPASFEKGPGENIHWKKSFWMGHPIGMWGRSLLFRNDYELDGEIVKARAYIAVQGCFEFSINGNKIRDSILDPGCTDVTKRVPYCTFDVSTHLKTGRNTIGIILGNGWAGNPRFKLLIRVTYKDGRIENIGSANRKGWHTAGGPIISNSIYDGELYDAREEKDGWDTPDYIIEPLIDSRNGWIHTQLVEGPCGELVPQIIEPIKVIRTIKPSIYKSVSDNKVVYDAEENIAGYAKILVSGERSSVVRIRFAENLYEDGTVNQENLRLAEAQDTYILKGSGNEEYCPRFTYHGFRYAQVETEGVVELKDIEFRVIRSSVNSTGQFSCSNELINKIHENIRRTEEGNLHSMPTDCPQRDERLGWLNDATSRAEETIYNYNMQRFFDKWMDDIQDTQDEYGVIADTAPYRWGNRPADPVVTSYILIPWLMYLHYGNKYILERHYEGFKKWVKYLDSISEDNIIHYTFFGDWASPASECDENSEGSGAVSINTPGSLMSTGYQIYNYWLLTKIAGLLGKKAEQEFFEKRHQEVTNAFNREFFDGASGKYALGSQGAQSFAIKLGAVDKEHMDGVMSVLLDEIEKSNYHLTTGNQTTKHMIEILTEHGYVDYAYKIITQTTYPSWGYMIKNGATTIWERWECATGKEMNSHNHPMHGAIGSWFYSHLAGIRPSDDEPGYGKIMIKPYLPDELDWVKASLNTVKGEVVSEWKKADKKHEFLLKIPENTVAVISLPLDVGNNLESTQVYESGELLWDSGTLKVPESLLNGKIESGRFIFEVGSGNYIFTMLYS